MLWLLACVPATVIEDGQAVSLDAAAAGIVREDEAVYIDILLHDEGDRDLIDDERRFRLISQLAPSIEQLEMPVDWEIPADEDVVLVVQSVWAADSLLATDGTLEVESGGEQLVRWDLTFDDGAYRLETWGVLSTLGTDYIELLDD